jgi:hypothetical protein
MKSVFFYSIIVCLGFFTACFYQPTPPAPAPPPEGSDIDELPQIMSLKIEGGSYVVPNPRKITTLIERKIEGDLQPIYLTQIGEGGTEQKSEATFVLTTGSAIAFNDLLEKIAALKQTDIKSDGPPMVGKSEKTYTITDGKGKNTILTVPNGVKIEAITALEALVASEMEAYTESQNGSAGKLAASLEGKVWQSDSDANRRISFRNGKLTTFNQTGEAPEHPFVSFRQWCPDDCDTLTKKNKVEGLKAGFICCMTIFAQDDECYAILEGSKNKLEYIRLGDEKAKSEKFTLLTRR